MVASFTRLSLFEAQLPKGAPVSLVAMDGLDVAETLTGLDIQEGVEVLVYDRAGQLVGRIEGHLPLPGAGMPRGMNR